MANEYCYASELPFTGNAATQANNAMPMFLSSLRQNCIFVYGNMAEMNCCE